MSRRGARAGATHGGNTGGEEAPGLAVLGAGRRVPSKNLKFGGLFPNPAQGGLRNPHPTPKGRRGTRPAALGTGEGPRPAEGLETKLPPAS